MCQFSSCIVDTVIDRYFSPYIAIRIAAMQRPSFSSCMAIVVKSPAPHSARYIVNIEHFIIKIVTSLPVSNILKWLYIIVNV